MWKQMKNQKETLFEIFIVYKLWLAVFAVWLTIVLGTLAVLKIYSNFQFSSIFWFAYIAINMVMSSVLTSSMFFIIKNVLYKKNIKFEKIYNLGKKSHHILHDLSFPLKGLQQEIATFDQETSGKYVSVPSVKLNYISASVRRLQFILNDLVHKHPKNNNSKWITRPHHFIDELVHEYELSKTLSRIIFERRYLTSPTTIGIDVPLQPFMRAVNNLIINAIQATNYQGKIILSTEIFGSYLKLSVHDNGCGISKGHIKFIQQQDYSPPSIYQTLENRLNHPKKTSKTGLGLSFVKEFITTQGGFFYIDSTLHIGCCASMFLPLKTNQQIFSCVMKGKQENLFILLTTGKSSSRWKKLCLKAGYHNISCYTSSQSFKNSSNYYRHRPSTTIVLSTECFSSTAEAINEAHQLKKDGFVFVVLILEDTSNHMNMLHAFGQRIEICTNLVEEWSVF